MHLRSAHSSPLPTRKPSVPGWCVEPAQHCQRDPTKMSTETWPSRASTFLFIIQRDCPVSARVRSYVSFYRVFWAENLQETELFQEQWEDKYTFKIVTNEEMSLICHANCELIHWRTLKKKSLPFLTMKIVSKALWNPKFRYNKDKKVWSLLIHSTELIRTYLALSHYRN